MKYDATEKVIVIFLSLLVTAGAILLFMRSSRPMTDFNVVSGGDREEVPLAEVQSMLEKARRVDLNEASEEELVSVPGIGAKTAMKIKAYRREHGDFENVDDLVFVEGIGQTKLERMRPYLKT